LGKLDEGDDELEDASNNEMHDMPKFNAGNKAQRPSIFYKP